VWLACELMALFGVFFVGQSFPITNQNFVQADQTHWVLDVSTMVKPQYEELKEVALFLPQPGSLDPSMGIGLYVSVGGSDWSYRGCVTVAHPSDVMPLEWPKNTSGGPAAAQIGIAVEPAAELMGKEGSKLGAREDFAKRVAMDLFNFMQSFSQAAAGGNIIVPTNCIDRWFTKFSHKFRVDPDFLTREKDKI